MSTEKDYYRLLGVPREAPEREIKRAYYELARKLHPDKAKTPEDAAKNAADLALISKAYNTLKDPKKRADYDSGLKGRPPAASSPSHTPAPSAAAPNTANTGGPMDSALGTPTAQPGASNSDLAAQRRTMAQKAFVRGMQLYKRSEFKQALPFFEAAVTNDPDSEPQYHLKLAQALMKTRGSFTRAVEHTQKACDMDTYNIEFKLVLAEIHEQAGVESKARQVYEDVLKWDQTNEVALNKLRLYQATDDSKKGILDKIGGLFSKGTKKK